MFYIFSGRKLQPETKWRDCCFIDAEVIVTALSIHPFNGKITVCSLFTGKPELKGYSLTPLSSDEVKAINSLLKR